MTSGHTPFATAFPHDEEAPPPVVDKVVAENKRDEKWLSSGFKK